MEDNKKILFLILLFTFIIYAPCLTNWFWLEDFRNIANSFLAKSNFIYLLKPVDTNKITSRPFFYFLYFIDYISFGLKSWGYHLTSILIHLLNVFLLFLLVKKITGKKESAYFAFILFAFSFAFSSAIFHNAQKDELISITFCLLTLLFFKRWIDSGRKRYYFYSLIFFFFGLISHENIVLFPIILFLYYFYVEQKRKRLKFFIPYLILSTCFFLFLLYSSPLTTFAFKRIEGKYSYSLIGIHPLKNLINYMVAFYFPNILQTRSINLNSIPFFPLIKIFIKFLLFITPCIFIYLFIIGNRIIRFSILWIIILLFPCLLFASTISTYYIYFPFPGFTLLLGENFYILKEKFKGKLVWKIIIIFLVLYFLASIITIQKIREKYKQRSEKSYEVLQEINLKIPFSNEIKHFYFLNAEDFNVNFLSENIQIFRNDRVIVHISLFDTQGPIYYDLSQGIRKKDLQFEKVIENMTSIYPNSWLITYENDKIIELKKIKNAKTKINNSNPGKK